MAVQGQDGVFYKNDPLKPTQEEHMLQLHYFQKVMGEVERNVDTPSRTTQTGT